MSEYISYNPSTGEIVIHTDGQLDTRPHFFTPSGDGREYMFTTDAWDAIMLHEDTQIEDGNVVVDGAYAQAIRDDLSEDPHRSIGEDTWRFGSVTVTQKEVFNNWFLPGIGGSGGRTSGISTVVYIIGGGVMAATGAVPEIGGAAPDSGTGAVTPTSTPTPTATPQQVSDERKQEYKAFIQEVDRFSARSPDSWSAHNETTLNITIRSDWTRPSEYGDSKHPVPESVLRAMNATEKPPNQVYVSFYGEDGTWYRNVTVKEEWADGFIGYELGIDAMRNRFNNHTETNTDMPEDARAPRFHITFDDVRRAYAKGIREKLTNESWEPSEYNTSGRGEVVFGESGLYHYNVEVQNSKIISKDKVIYVNILENEGKPGGHSLSYAASAYADLIDEQHYGVLFGEPGLVLRIRWKDPEAGNIYHTADIKSLWAQNYNSGQIDWGQYENLAICKG